METTESSIGRPTTRTPELVDKLLTKLGSGQSLLSICKEDGMPDTTTVYRWLRDEGPDADAFRLKYAQARENQADSVHEESLNVSRTGAGEIITDEKGALSTAHVQLLKLRVETCQKFAAQVAPRKYAPIQKTQLTGADGGPLAMTNVDAKELTDEQLASIIASRPKDTGDAGGSGTGTLGQAEGAPQS